MIPKTEGCDACAETIYPESESVTLCRGHFDLHRARARQPEGYPRINTVEETLLSLVTTQRALTDAIVDVFSRAMLTGQISYDLAADLVKLRGVDHLVEERARQRGITP